MDVEEYEQAAMNYAGKMGGEYLDSIDKSDLAKLSSEEWLTFLEVVCINFAQKRAELQPCPF